MNTIEWHGLYAESWGSDLVPEAYAHPAKYSRGLIRQIYAHMLRTGMIEPGDTVGDPFGGQAGGALDAMLNGLHWRGVELEPRFVELGNQNIALWNGRYAPHMRRWGTAVLVQGDSRRFAELVGGVACVVSSPPFLDERAINGRDIERTRKDFAIGQSNVGQNEYGDTPGQLGSMKEGNLDAAITSPPYADTVERGDGPGARWDADGHPGNPDKVSSDASYGRSPGQVGRLDAVVTSPPYVDAINSAGSGINWKKAGENRKQGGIRVSESCENFRSKSGELLAGKYGTTEGQLGSESADTFWAASRAIVEQVHLALKPGGYVAFVTGDFVRRGKRVEFGRQWLALCEACGFTAVTWAVAWKTEHHGAQLDIFGNAVEMRKDRVSFFRRLANEKNPDAAILNEDVIFMQKAPAVP